MFMCSLQEKQTSEIFFQKILEFLEYVIHDKIRMRRKQGLQTCNELAIKRNFYMTIANNISHQIDCPKLYAYYAYCEYSKSSEEVFEIYISKRLEHVLNNKLTTQ